MSIDKKKAAKILDEIALLLDLKGENRFKIRAYENASRTLLTLDDDLESLVRSGKLAEVKGFGKAIVEKLTELVTTGTLPYWNKLKAEFPPTLLDLLNINGVGPKKVKLFYQELNIQSVDDLESACGDGRVAALPGLGQKTAEKILFSISRAREFQSLFLYQDAYKSASEMLEYLRALPEIQKVEIAGSLRRLKAITKDIDIIASSDSPVDVMERFINSPAVSTPLSQGTSKSSVLLHNGIHVDLRVVPDHVYPYALHHFTGSKEHNVAIRSLAIGKGLKVSEWGLFRTNGEAGNELIACSEESELFAKLGMTYIPPELRENRGEIEAAEQNNLPNLVHLDDYRGVLHCHSQASDGVDRIEALAECAVAMGHSYLGITDHSKASFQANGLSEQRLSEQVEHIKKLRDRYSDRIHLFSGIECDILKDGTLDFSDDILGKLDFVIVSVHSSFSLAEQEMTRRIIRAIEHPATRILAHPTGRLLLKRDAYNVDMDRVIDAAAANNVAIELNCNPMRMDMDWQLWKNARNKGVLCSLNPDAHSVEQFSFIQDGIGCCRKGWLEARDIINCWPVSELATFLSGEFQS